MKKLLVLAAVLLASACGVQPTGVVSAGPAPTLHDTASSELILYFVQDGHVVSVTRPESSQLSATQAILILLTGPTAAEARRGLTTDLPAIAGPVVVDPDTSPGFLNVGFDVLSLPETAVNQLSCTAMTALARTSQLPRAGVVISGPDGKLGLRGCRTF
jgi:hypothetical protein